MSLIGALLVILKERCFFIPCVVLRLIRSYHPQKLGPCLVTRIPEIIECVFLLRIGVPMTDG